MTRTILRGTKLVLSAERAHGVPEGIYSAECMTCPATSGRTDSDPNPVARWALLHTDERGLDHAQYLVTVERHWRVDPAGVRNGHVGAAVRVYHRARTPSPASPSRRPSGRLEGCRRRVVGWVGRFAGPLVLAAFVAVAIGSGYLMGSG